DDATARGNVGRRPAQARPRPHHAGGKMISAGQLLSYAVASFVLIVVPGPGVLFVVGRALAHGRRTAIATAAGHAARNYALAACRARRTRRRCRRWPRRGGRTSCAGVRRGQAGGGGLPALAGSPGQEAPRFVG